NEALENFKIHGEFESSRILAQFNENQLSKYMYESSIQQANISISEHGLAASSIVGEVIGDHRQGNIDLASSAATLTIDKILNQPLETQDLRGVINWQHIDDQLLFALQELSVGSNEMTANIQGTVQIIANEPFADLQVDIPYVKAKTLKQYFPYKRMKPKLSKWLNNGIAAGTLRNGKLLLHGNPKYIPFKDKPGKLEITANIEDGVLNYRENWPIASNIIADFRIKNNFLEVNASQGMILDSSIHQVYAQIDDLKLAKIVIDGNAVGPASDILKYLQQSSLLPKNSKLVKNISASGNVKLDLNIVLTLTKKLEKQRLVSGVINFNDAGLNVNALSLPFTNLNGILSFDKNGAEGKGLTARLYGAQVSANAKKISNGRTLLSVSGDIDLDTYFSSNYTKLNKYIKGIAPVSAEINLPKFGKNSIDKSLIINVNSDLYGATTLLPDPLKKAFDETRHIAVQTKHQPGMDSNIFANLDGQIFMQARIDQAASDLYRIELRMGDEQFSLPDNGIKISGKMNSLDISEWRTLMQSEEEQTFEIKQIDLFVNHVQMGGLGLNKVNFRATKNAQFWEGDISSSEAKGKFEYPISPRSGSIATAEFDYLRFKFAQNNSTPLSKSTGLDPRDLPALVVNTEQFEYKDAVFNNVSLKTKPIENGLTIDSLKGNGRELQVSANGDWIVENGDVQKTNLRISLISQNTQNSLSGLGFDSEMKEGEGSVSANFSWPNAPYRFSLASATGKANLRLKDGVISSVEPGGAGRLVGLFNLGEISRRLSLD
ncbi:MAG: DUF3971 domain-containing protein, partial [Gammaproteobacteria bacterium]